MMGNHNDHEQSWIDSLLPRPFCRVRGGSFAGIDLIWSGSDISSVGEQLRIGPGGWFGFGHALQVGQNAHPPGLLNGLEPSLGLTGCGWSPKQGTH